MPAVRVVVFCMSGRGHFHRIRSVTASLRQAGFEPVVFTHQMFQPDVERVGGVFRDLFTRFPVDAADPDSWPEPVRYTAHAAMFGAAITEEVRALRPAIILHDTFAVVGSIVARRLGVPHVNICSGHNVAPEPFLKLLNTHPRVVVSDHCRRAVDALRADGLPDASPFAYVTNQSPYLNLYCEPPEFLDEAERRPFEPIAFFGSLQDPSSLPAGRTPSYFGVRSPGQTNVYLSFGTVIWDVREREALLAIGAIAEFVSQQNMRVVVSLGGRSIPPEERARIERPNLRVETLVDQWSILQETDVFVTHSGLNSVHEAIYHQVPMLSYPFAWDHPALAKKCVALGLAIPFVAEPMAPLSAEDVARAFARITRERDAVREKLAVARTWEADVVRNRPRVLQQIADLAALPA